MSANASSTTRSRARALVRTFSTTSSRPSRIASTGRRPSTEPRAAANAPNLPPARRCSTVSTANRTVVVADGAAVALAAERRAATTTVRFAVDTLEHLRAGGRLGAFAATLGSVLGLRPVLAIRDGRLDVVEKVRTSARARDRVVELALADIARRDRFELAVHH